MVFNLVKNPKLGTGWQRKNIVSQICLFYESYVNDVYPVVKLWIDTKLKEFYVSQRLTFKNINHLKC